ncbi:DgyrCDS5956 [Dimorphilus gyrociliatus]|uniref:DgyrCDS5956 n=1 Tax=Dimorphilus gyrociliatus TaxID=2664684 RepID=A0A7I8VLK7_9ANNE|nr:DgyrCDS5956 [Dimorphilus gyrociliatus]
MVYVYTKPRGPIAAMYSSPGPCYGLRSLVGAYDHDPRSVHSKGPAHSFGIRHGKWRDDAGPGPAYFPDPKIYKDGMDGSPHYSLYSRPRDSAAFKTPGPGTYSPERTGPSAKKMPPAYTFGLRHLHRRTDNTPAPNNYSLPAQMGRTIQSGKRQAPIYSMTGRSKRGGFHEDLSRTPGPGAYGTANPDIYKLKGPTYSLTSRNMMPSDATRKPGPGAHQSERVWAHKRAAPAFSMGIRHSQYICPLILNVDNC